MRFGRSRPAKVIDFDTNRKRVCNFLLVRRSNLGPILHRFRDIAGFLLMTLPIFHPNLGVIPLDQIAHVVVIPSINLKLISREIIFEVFQQWSRYLNVTERQTDGWTDGRTDNICGIIALCGASRRKNQYDSR